MAPPRFREGPEWREAARAKDGAAAEPSRYARRDDPRTPNPVVLCPAQRRPPVRKSDSLVRPQPKLVSSRARQDNEAAAGWAAHNGHRCDPPKEVPSSWELFRL
jgi:hypothetical protein